MMDNDPNASHDMSELADWLAESQFRSHALSIEWVADVPGVGPSLQCHLDLYTESGVRIPVVFDIGYGLRNGLRDALAKTRPVSRPEPKFPRALLGPRNPLAEPNPTGKRPVANFESMVAAEKAHDPCEEGEG